MFTVNQCLKNKGEEIWSTSPDDTVYNALRLLAEKDVGALLVLEDDKLVGIFSEVWVVRRCMTLSFTKERKLKHILTELGNLASVTSHVDSNNWERYYLHTVSTKTK